MFDATAADSSATFFQNLDPALQGTFSLDLAQIPDAAMELLHTRLADFSANPGFLDVLRIPFGDFDEAQASALFQDFLMGDVSHFPQIEILAADVLQGANGAFDSLTGTIYLSDSFLSRNADNPAAIAGVLLEEIGHYIDAQINVVDSPGDEGAIFSAIVQGQDLTTEDLARLQTEDDTATIVIGNRSILVERSDYAGNTLGTARNIGTLSGTQTFSDFVGSTDTNDFYRFNLGSRSNFSLTLNGMSADADVQLIQDVNNNGIFDSGEVLARSINNRTTPDSISRTLDAGNYFVRVYPFLTANNTNYNLSLNALPSFTASPTGQVTVDGGTYTWNLSRYDATGRTHDFQIDPNAPTIVVAHGRVNNASDSIGNLEQLARTSASIFRNTQILLLDWRNASADSSTPPYSAGSRIGAVANSVYQGLRNLGLTQPNNLHFYGHSLGSLLLTKVAENYGRIAGFVSLDPAFPAEDYNLDNDSNRWEDELPDLRAVANRSVSLVGEDTAILGAAGDNNYAMTAHRAYIVDFLGNIAKNIGNAGRLHNAIVDVFRGMVSSRLGGYALTDSNNLNIRNDQWGQDGSQKQRFSVGNYDADGVIRVNINNELTSLNVNDLLFVNNNTGQNDTRIINQSVTI